MGPCDRVTMYVFHAHLGRCWGRERGWEDLPTFPRITRLGMKELPTMPPATLGKRGSRGFRGGRRGSREEEAPFQLWFSVLGKAEKDPRLVTALSWKGILGRGTV